VFYHRGTETQRFLLLSSEEVGGFVALGLILKLAGRNSSEGCGKSYRDIF